MSLKIQYFASVEPLEENKTLRFKKVWDDCGGRYPFKVMAIDSSKNKNGWGIPSEKLKEFAAKMAGIQCRLDHSDKYLDIHGEVESAAYDEEQDKVFATAWTHEKAIAKRIHMGTGKYVSMQAEATDIRCGVCASKYGACECKATWKSLYDPTPIEMSNVARGAYPNAGLVSGFAAALDNYFQGDETMNEKDINTIVERLKAELDLKPAPEKTDNSTKVEQPKVPQSDGHEVPSKSPLNKAGEEEDYKKKYEKAMDELQKMKKESKTSKKAKDEGDKEFEKAEEEEKEEKKEKAALKTLSTFSASRRQEAPSGAQQFKADFSASDKEVPDSYEAFMACEIPTKDGITNLVASTGRIESDFIDEFKAEYKNYANHRDAHLYADLLQLGKDSQAHNVHWMR